MKRNNAVNLQDQKKIFDQNLERLKEFVQMHSRFPVRIDNTGLFEWTNALRAQFNNGRLDKVQVEQLNAIGFIWTTKDCNWFFKAKEVKDLLLKERIIPSCTMHAALYGWLRDNLDRLRNNVLPPDKEKIIEEIKTIINTRKLPHAYGSLIKMRARELMWEERFKELVRFRKLHTKYWPRSTSKNKQEQELSKWCSMIRAQFKKNALNDYWINKLEAIGFNYKERDRQRKA